MSQGQPRRLLVIYNPTTGRRARRRLETWLDELRRLGSACTVQETARPGHAEELARAADSGAVDAVVAAGGDGTINEVLNGLTDSALPLALLPLGTANVLAAELGLPRRLGDLAALAAFAPTRLVWPGEVVTSAGAARRFLLMAGVGFDAEVVARCNGAWKRRVGKLAYVASIFGRLRDYPFDRFSASIDGVAVAPATLVAARAHFYGGRFVLAPRATLDHARFEVVQFERTGRGAALAYLMAMVLGTLPRRRDVRIISGDVVELLGPAGAPIQLDGDIRVRLPALLRVAAAPQAIIAPPL
jgi:diacylglycerol kinase family enzyme